jgi:hypothetical protein
MTEQISDGVIKPVCVPTEEMRANIFDEAACGITKVLCILLWFQDCSEMDCTVGERFKGIVWERC